MISTVEYNLLNHVITFDAREVGAVIMDFDERTVRNCIRAGLIEKKQDYEAYWDDKERLSVTSAGILELNIFRLKEEKARSKQE